jgi:putative membrane protein
MIQKQNANLMKKLFFTMAILGAALAFQGCGSGSGSATDTSDTSKMAADSMAAMDTNTMDTTAMSTDQMDVDFANKAAVGGMAEVQFGKLAQEKGSSAKVKDFAAMMVKDHGMANTELMSIAKSKNITLPTALDAEHMKKLTELQSKSGTDFDKAYVTAMVEGHQKTLALMQDGAANCKDSKLKDFAAKTAPIVKTHLDMITKIQAEMK